MSYKTIYQMTLSELRNECVIRNIDSVGSKDDLLVILEQRVRNDGFNPRSSLFPVTVSRPHSGRSPIGQEQGVVDSRAGSVGGNSADQYIDDGYSGLENPMQRHSNGVPVGGSCVNSRRGNSRLNLRSPRTVTPPRQFDDDRQLHDLVDDIRDVGEQVRREVDLFGIENRLQSIEVALVGIRGSLRSISDRQWAIENRLDAFTRDCRNSDDGQSRNVHMSDNRSNRRTHLNVSELNSRLMEIEREVQRTKRGTRFPPQVSPTRQSNCSSNFDNRDTGCPTPPYTRIPSAPEFGNLGNDARDAQIITEGQPICSTRVGGAPPPQSASSLHQDGHNNWCHTNTVHFNDQPCHDDENVRGTGHVGNRTQNPVGSIYNFKLTPPQFYGRKNEDPKSFINKTEVVLRNSGIDESDWIRLIGDQLSEVAAEWYTTIRSLDLT